jgi:hypothetical protein
MNNVAILPKSVMYFLQNQNVKREVAKKVPSMPAQVEHNDKAPSVIPSASASASASASVPVLEQDKSTEVGGTNISDLLNTTTA